MERNDVYFGDCLELLPDIETASVNLILCDLPYGTTPASWDKQIPMDKLWKQYERIIKDDGAIVLTAQQPFTSLLITSNLKLYKYNWFWEKDNGTNFLNSPYQPLKITEDICVFGKGATSFTASGTMMKYNPQFTQGKPYSLVSGNQKSNSAVVRGGVGGREDVGGHETVSDGRRYPKNVIRFNRDKDKVHETQKPINLFRYLILTYTDKGDLVLDNCCGSGTTAEASVAEGRDFICMENDEKSFLDTKKRIQERLSKPELF